MLQIAHGLTEYGQRYEDFAEFLTGYGYAVAVNDVIGHGESVTPGEEPVHIEKWEHTVKDFGTCRRRTEERFGGLPYYMLGFSLGSFILHSYLTEHAQGIQGVILAGTGMIPGSMTCGFFYQFLSGMEYVNQHRKELKLQAPVLLISSARDPVGDFGKGVEKLYSRYRKMGITVELKLIPEYRHDILHDGCRREVWEYIREWMESRGGCA